MNNQWYHLNIVPQKYSEILSSVILLVQKLKFTPAHFSYDVTTIRKMILDLASLDIAQ